MSDNTYQLPVWDTISVAWSKVLGSKSPFWGSIAIFMLIMFGLGILEGMLSLAGGGIDKLLNFISSIVSYFIGLGIIYMGITRAQDRPISFQMMFYAFKGELAVRIIGLYLLTLIIFLVPMLIAGFSFGFGIAAGGIVSVICILLGLAAVAAFIVIGVRISLSMAYVLDRGCNPWDAVKQSFHATQSNFWNLLGLFILQTIIVAVSAIPLGIGLIWTLPFSYICYGVAYLRLSNNS